VAVTREEMSGTGLNVFSAIGLNDASRLLFYGGVRGGETSLYAFDDSPVQIAAPGGTVLPIAGTTWAPENFTDHTRVLVGGGGHVAVRALLAGADAASDDAVIVFDPGLTVVRAAAREGDDAPGVSGASFGPLTRTVSSLPTNSFGMNASGNILIRAELVGPSVTSADRDSLWVYDYAEDALRLLVRQGQQVLVDGDPYTLVEFGVQLGSGGQDGLPTGYNDAGEIALRIDLVPGEPPGAAGGQRRRIIGILDDRQFLARIGSAPIGAPLDGGLDDAGGPTTPPSGSGPCSVSVRETSTGAGWMLLVVAGVVALRRRR
jgi:MYXO-CTERM domain-containing protein